MTRENCSKKPVLSSMTIWVNVIFLLALAAQEILSHRVIDQSWEIALLAIANIILRFKTMTGIIVGREKKPG